MTAEFKPKAARTFARVEHEWYQEPQDCTTALLTAERFLGLTWDPCCGAGNIVQALRAGGVEACGSDIVQRVSDETPWFLWTSDFLKDDRPSAGVVNIVMNPPFYRAVGTEAFIRKALSIATGKVAAFVDYRFLAGGKRASGLFTEHPPSRVWILAPRPSCPPGAYLAAGNKAGGGTADWCWLVWDLTAPAGDTRFGWLRRTPA